MKFPTVDEFNPLKCDQRCPHLAGSACNKYGGYATKLTCDGTELRIRNQACCQEYGYTHYSVLRKEQNERIQRVKVELLAAVEKLGEDLRGLIKPAWDKANKQ